VSHEPDSTNLLRALEPVLRAFGNRWYVFGAQAVVVWGRPRLTADVDVTCFLDPDDPTAFAAAMRRGGFELRVRDAAGFVKTTRVLPFVHLATGLPVDIVLAGPGLEEEFERAAVRIDVHGTTIPFIAAEDLLVTKILAGRPKDLEDVRGILLARHATLDIEHVRARLRLLEAALGQSDLLPLLDEQVASTRRCP